MVERGGACPELVCFCQEKLLENRSFTNDSLVFTSKNRVRLCDGALRSAAVVMETWP